MTPDKLIELAKDAMKNSYSPYSEFTVGSALLTKSNKVYLGCNIENSAYSPTCCAERVAFFKAVSDGEKDFEAIAIVGGKDENTNLPCPPCGVCRQVMQEFCNCNTFKIYLGKKDGFDEYLLKDLLPAAFKNQE